jgi:hypothetical protein
MLNTSRRSLIASLPVAAVAVALPAAAVAATGDAAIQAAWARWQQARATYKAMPCPDEEGVDGTAIKVEENRLWAVMDEAEETIRASRATTQRGTAIQLWVALAHSIDTNDQDAAITCGELSPILATEHTLDWNARLIVAALQSLNGGAAQ